MAFDGITISAITHELNDKLIEGRIYKIAQPESDELLLTIKNNSETYRLLISANASLPLIYLTDENKMSPITAPNFCMLLRKHIQNGRIVAITQPSLERIINIDIEHLNEMGDLCSKRLIIELMGKHSNIIFVDSSNMIIDSIKHVSAQISSVREVLPGREYFIPETSKKINPLSPIDENEFIRAINENVQPLYKALYTSYTGISPFFAYEICNRALIDGDMSNDSPYDARALFNSFRKITDQITNGNFSPEIYYENSSPSEYSAIPVESYSSDNKKSFESISALLIYFYSEKEKISRIRQKSVDLRRIVQTTYEKDIRKCDIYIKQLKDTEKKDKYRVYGELLNTYGYNCEPNAKSITVLNYYTNEDITIPLDPDFTAIENAKKYFDKYGKLKRTEEAVNALKQEVDAEISHLESIQNALDIAETEADLSEIKEELVSAGYIKSHGNKKNKQRTTSKPFHYITKEGFHIYVGKNNIQNEYITFDLANGNDWWFHAKKIPGSHVIVKTEGKEIPDSVFEDAARLAAYYSKAKGNSRIEVDYVKRKEVKHPNGSKPGFVVYYTNYSMLIDSDISHIKQITD